MSDIHVLASFGTKAEAREAVAFVSRRLPDVDVHLGDVDDELDALAIGQEAEVGESIPLVGGGLFSGPMARGALVWGAVGLVVGALIGGPIAFAIDVGPAGRWAVIAACALAGALAVSSVTFILGAGAQAVREGETEAVDPTAVVRVDGAGQEADHVVDLLLASGARRADVLDHPVPRPPASDVESPRPVHGRPAPGRSEEQAESDAGFRPKEP